MVRKFLVEVKDEAFEELESKMNKYYSEHGEDASGSVAVLDLFFVELSPGVIIDIRSDVKVTEVTEKSGGEEKIAKV